jgi:hypothetical protein
MPIIPFMFSCPIQRSALRCEKRGLIRKNKKGEILADFSLFAESSEDYFFFLTAFLAGAFLAGAFFLVAMENHPLFRSH